MPLKSLRGTTLSWGFLDDLDHTARRVGAGDLDIVQVISENWLRTIWIVRLWGHPNGMLVSSLTTGIPIIVYTMSHVFRYALPLAFDHVPVFTLCKA